ncbi:chorismate mutase [Alicyclobacillus sp. ALC3]|nr:chorismate mutase [Alicyclobacillus sp. ALC3]
MELIRCMAKRLELSKEIATRKKQMSSPVLQPDRATVVQNNYRQLADDFGLSAAGLGD